MGTTVIVGVLPVWGCLVDNFALCRFRPRGVFPPNRFVFGPKFCFCGSFSSIVVGLDPFVLGGPNPARNIHKTTWEIIHSFSPSCWYSCQNVHEW